MSYRFGLQLMDATTGRAIITAGGKVFVATNGGSSKTTLTSDAEGSALTNPMTPTRGGIEFYASVSKVDLYILAPGGQFVVVKDVEASGPNEVSIDTSNRSQCMVVPFDIADTTADTETASGFVIPTKAGVLPSPLVEVVTLDATETIDVGTDSGDSGDADGFVDGASVATAGLVKATLDNAAPTLGTKLFVQDSANAGDDAPEIDVSQAGKEITWTLSAGSDTAAGFIFLPYLLAA
ncbi:hypothetical protein QMT40_001787 [Parvibaculaceae bacterium PLY_AMNH_Bact1]|nr:hypothetical protein QMT40_001787 [Parvibaculaceae bacterium PLY_AMNH_Bact1]